MSELLFLIDLLLNEKLSKEVKTKLANRIREIEANAHAQRPVTTLQPVKVPGVGVQAGSTAALMAKHAAEDANGFAPPAMPPIPEVTQEGTPQPGVVVASPAAAMAIQSRNQALTTQLSGKSEPGRTSPRKW